MTDEQARVVLDDYADATKIKLKPCPFCGETAIMQVSSDGWKMYRCEHCHASVPYGICTTFVKAANWWNRRYPENKND